MPLFETIIANTWNRAVRLMLKRKLEGGQLLGMIVVDNRATKLKYFLPQQKRTEHISVLGRTGQGKSFLILYFCMQDILAVRIDDQHGSLIPLILSFLASEEKRTGKDLS